MSGSIYFPGNGSFVQVSGSSEFSIPTSTTPFTIECWLYPITGDSTFFSEVYTGGGDTISMTMGFCDGTNVDSAGRYLVLAAYNGSSWSSSAVSTAQVDLLTWTHVAAVFTGSTTKIFINGGDVTKSSSPTPSSTWSVTLDNTDGLYIGRRWDTYTRTWYQGYISNFRLNIGSALYTANFAVATDDLTSVTNTKLLVGNDALAVVDRSSNNFAVTKTGGASASSATPFRPSWLGEGAISREDFDSDSSSNESKQYWSNTQIGFKY